MANRPRRTSRPATASRGANRSGNPARRAAAAPASPAARRRLERFSAPVLVTLHGLPRWLVPVALAAMLFAGLTLRDSWAWLAAVFLFIVAVFVSWLTALSWPILTPTSRAIRVVVAFVLFALTLWKALGRF